jgi:hypothetical protein
MPAKNRNDRSPRSSNERGLAGSNLRKEARWPPSAPIASATEIRWTTTAAVELINVLRPTMPVARFVTFAALALHTLGFDSGW